MFRTRKVNHKINRLHERGLRALLNDENSTFNDMLAKSNDTTIHVKIIQKLMIEFYKYLYGLSAPIMKEVFIKGILKYNLRNCRDTPLSNPKTNKYRTDTVAYKASQLWNTLPTRYKNLISLYLFKSEIKSWNCSDCPCNICRIFVDGELYKLKLREIAKRCTYRSINILAVFEISQENVCCENLSGKCLP